jgi:ribosomal protein L40E
MTDESVPVELRCSECGAVHSADARRCVSCGAPLVQECPACGAENPLGAARCQTCGQALELVDELFARITSSRAGWLSDVRQEAGGMKAEAEAASQARLEAMWAEEAERQEELAAARAERERQQRILVMVAVGVAVVVVLAVLVTLLLTAGNPGP